MAQVKKEEAKRQAQLAYLASFPKTLNKLSSPELVINTNTSTNINSSLVIFYNNTYNIIQLDSKGIEDNGPNTTSSSLD